MTLKEWLKCLNKSIELNPLMLEMQIVTAIDDEGNGFKPVNYEPSTGKYEDGEFEDEDSLDNAKDVNAVCLN